MILSPLALVCVLMAAWPGEQATRATTATSSATPYRNFSIGGAKDTGRADGFGSPKYGKAKTDRGTFGAARAFPIRERCLLGTSVRQRVVPSNPVSEAGGLRKA